MTRHSGFVATRLTSADLAGRQANEDYQLARRLQMLLTACFGEEITYGN